MPKPKKQKKKFIDPRNERTTTFSLIHRSQKDPLAADSDAPQRLLQAIPDQKGAKQQKEEEHEFGVFYDDEYDYLQHLKKRDENEKDFDEIDRFLLDKDDLKTEEKKPSKKEPQLSSNLKLPNIVFASGTEEEVGLLNKAARSQGPLLDWDPEIVETLDDEFTHEVVYTLKDLERQDEEEEEEEAMEENELDEILAGAKVERDDDDECSDDYDDYDSDEANDDVPSLDGGFSTFSAEETKSKFTSYSMSSSVIRRNDGLSLLDDKFDKFFDGYDDENMGYLDMDDVEGSKAETSEVMSHVLKDFEKQQATRRQKMTEHDLAGTTIAEDNSDTDKELEEKEVDKDEDKFDCESIISTYSTLYNHPKLIKEPSIKAIRVSGKTGIPKDVFGKGLTSVALKQLNRENEKLRRDCINSDTSSEDDVETMTLASRVSQLSFRSKHETTEEKKARKLAVKDLRRERRVERKANRDAFKEEKTMQEKHAINNRLTSQAIKLL